MELQPPPNEGPYQSIQEALQSLNRYAALQGYAIVKSRSRTYKGKPYRVYIACDRGGRVRKALVGRLRQGATRQTGCPFQGLFRCENGLWYLELIKTTHNHPPSDPIAHPTHRRLPPEALELIAEQCRANVPPKEIIISLRLGSRNIPQSAAPPTAKDIYNIQAAIRNESLGA